MRAILIGLALTFSAALAVAQQPAAAPEPAKTFTSAADVAALIAKAKVDQKQGQPMVAERILHLAPYNANLEYRSGIAPASVHEKEAEVFYVIEGSGTIVIGGKLVGEKRTNPENLSGTAIEGGAPQPMAKGDFLVVPENTPHWFSSINGTIVLMTLHVPRTAAAAQP